jgi:thiamine kinase
MPPSDAHAELERLACKYLPGEGPVSLERLGAGLVNATYRATRAGRCYSLRVPAPHGEGLGVDRDWECRVLARAAAADLAPPVERCEPSLGILISHWVEGAALTAREVRTTECLEAVARLILRIHALPMPDTPRRVTPEGWVFYYRAALECCGREARFAGLELELAAQLAECAALPAHPAVLCHSDLHTANLIVTAAGMRLLDWEYAHVSDAWWDLAGWSCNNDLTPEERGVLIESYLGRAPGHAELARLRCLAWLYDYVCLSWSELYLARAGRDRAEVSARAEILARRLNP